MKLKLLVAALGVAASGFALADTYQADVAGGAARYDVDGVNSNFNRYDVSGHYYFNAVKTDNLPLAETAYLGKNSNFFAGYARTHGDGLVSKINSYEVGLEVYIPESFLYVKAAAQRDSIDGYHQNDWYTSVGITPIDGLRITTEYDHEDGYDANIHAKYVTALGNGQFINLETGATDGDDGNIFNVGGDFYFDNTFSVGGDIADYGDGNAYTVRTTKFFTEQFSGEVSYTDSDDDNIIRVGLSYRF
jgi:Putative general bacterial porin